MKKIVSGIQPTGVMHLGNYLGSVRNWVELQHSHESYLFIADLHAITLPQKRDDLLQSVRFTAASLIACGLDPDKNILFHQSAVPQHAELGWILSCMTSIGWLNKMIQFKDKAGKDKEKASLGLYSYPVLQAADILIYKADIVPVGEDQKQHIELTRDIAESFNRHTNSQFFKTPEPLIYADSGRIMSLRDGSKKMSKSDTTDASRINLTDSAEEISQKIKKAKTDSIANIYYDKENRPEISNLLRIYHCLSGKKIADLEAEFANINTGQFKQNLIDLLVDRLLPIGNKIQELMQNQDHLENILFTNAQKAKEIAEINLNKIKDLLGFIHR